MKRSRLTHFRVVLLCMSIGLLVAVVMPALAQEEAAAEQPGVGAIVGGEAMPMPPRPVTIIGETPDILVPVSSEVDDSPVCETVRLHYVREPRALQRLLEPVKAALAPDVNVAASEGLSLTPLVVLAGPRSQVDDLKRVIATIDVPQPQVRLDLWTFQISGGDAQVVAGRAQEARETVRTVGDLMRGYLRQLEACARASQQHNQERAEKAQQQASTSRDDEASDTEPCFSIKMNVVDLGDLLPGQSTILITPSARGPHPLSLTETLATLLMMPPAGGLSWRQTLEQHLSQSLGRWLDGLSRQDPAALAVWRSLVDTKSTVPATELSTLLSNTIMASQEGPPDSQEASVTPLLPGTLLHIFDDAAYLKLTQQTIGNFLLDSRTQARDWRALAPDRLSRRAADVDVVLQAAERALAADVEAIFLRPLLDRLRAIAGSSGQSGLASTSSTSIVVLGGTQATVTGSARSYFELNAPPEEEQPVAVAQGELPVMPLVTLAESLRTADEPRVWGSMTEGTELTFTPHILPGGAAAELQVAVTVAHKDAEVTVEGVEEPTTAPLSRVAEHTASTSVYVNALDLFSLSSMMLRTTQPRAKSSVPVLGQLPVLGEMFRFGRSPLIVHHESVLLVYSTILPTGQDLGALLDFQAVPTPAS